MKTCNKCHEEKELSEFHKNGAYYRATCKECHNATRRTGTIGTVPVPPALEKEESLEVESFALSIGTTDWQFGTGFSKEGEECQMCGKMEYLFRAQKGMDVRKVCNDCTLLLIAEV